MRDKFFTSTATLALLGSQFIGSPALAQPPVPYLWSGLYVGVNAGGSSFDQGNQFGFSGGGQIGYNFQRYNWVFGIEADIQSAVNRKNSFFNQSTFTPGVAGIPATLPMAGSPEACDLFFNGKTIPLPGYVPGSGSAGCTFPVGETTYTPAVPPSPGTPAVPAIPAVTTTYDQQYSGRLSSFETVRGRIGFTPAANLLIYATGGAAFGQATLDYSLVTTTTTAGVGTTITTSPASHSHSTLFGYTVGAGAEYALSKNWSVKGEYLWIDLGSRRLGGGYSPAAGVFLPVAEVRFTVNVARLGLNYHF